MRICLRRGFTEVKRRYGRQFLSVLLAALFVTGPALAQEPAGGWEGSLQALWLKRDQGDRIMLAEERAGQNGGALLQRLTTGSLDAGHEPGLRIALLFPCTARTGLEVAYFGLHDWSDSAALSNSDPEALSPNRLFSPGLNGSDANAAFDVIERIQVRLSSDLHSFEVNLRHRLGNDATTLLAGIRYLSFDEDLRIAAGGQSIEGEPASDRTRVKARNHLLGVQGGAGHHLAWQPWRLDLAAKAGLFANVNSQEIDQAGIAEDGSDRIDLEGDEVSLAGVVDAGIGLRLLLLENVCLRAGYQLLVVAGLAEAPDQLALLGDAAHFSAPVRDSSAGTSHDGTVIFHGPHVGLDIRW